MQRRTVDYVHSRHAPDERLSGREAAYPRDEVHGPLSGKFTGSAAQEPRSVDHGKTVKKTIREETVEVLEDFTQTPSEANVSLSRSAGA